MKYALTYSIDGDEWNSTDTTLFTINSDHKQVREHTDDVVREVLKAQGYDKDAIDVVVGNSYYFLRNVNDTDVEL